LELNPEFSVGDVVLCEGGSKGHQPFLAVIEGYVVLFEDGFYLVKIIDSERRFRVSEDMLIKLDTNSLALLCSSLQGFNRTVFADHSNMLEMDVSRIFTYSDREFDRGLDPLCMEDDYTFLIEEVCEEDIEGVNDTGGELVEMASYFLESISAIEGKSKIAMMCLYNFWCDLVGLYALKIDIDIS